MRLSEKQIHLISETVCRIAGPETELYLFGSRLDDNARGGDVDLFVESTTALPLMRRAQIKMQLESLLGLPVDLVCKTKNTVATPFQIIARSNAVKLGLQ